MENSQLSQAEIDQFRESVSTWHRIPRNEVEELISDALFAFSQRSRREHIAKPLHWLVSAASRISRKRQKLRLNQIECEAINSDPEFKTCHEEPSEYVTSLWQAIEALRPEYRRVIETCDLLQEAPRDAAKQLSRPYRTVQTHRRRAYEKLARNKNLKTILTVKA
jgi:DNA-directed RNA polymerase specialized sigma24 family protein